MTGAGSVVDDRVPAPSPALELTRPLSRRRSRRPLVVVGVVVLTGAAGMAAALAAGGDDDAPAPVQAATATATVERRDLVVTDEYEGQLGFGEASVVVANRSGVVTAVSPVGTVVVPGSPLYEIDLQPTVLLSGGVPAFRSLSVDSEDGADVRQLEQALVDLGHGEGVTVDEEFTDETADAVEAWEEALGRFDPDGVVELGDVVFRPEPVRLATVSAEVGTQVQADSTVVEVTPIDKVVSLDLGVDAAARVEGGTPVGLELPDGTATTGTVTQVGSEPTSSAAGEGGEPTVAVTVVPDDPAAAGGFDAGTVTVTVERSRVDGATAVPVSALLALAEGGYAVQVVDDASPGGYRLVGVDTGSYADGFVEVAGTGIEPGVVVVVPG